MGSTVFKKKLAAGLATTLINADHACATLVNLVCRLGVDAIMLDCEQGNLDFKDIEHMTYAARLHGTASVVRVPSAEPWTIERHMLRDIDGIVVPRLDTAAQAARAVEDIRYCVPKNFADKTIIIQIESASAVAELDDFLTIPDIDCFFIGAVDLAKSMGFAGDHGRPEVMRAMEETVARICQKGKRAGFFVNAGNLAAWRAKGVTMLYAHLNEFIDIGRREWMSLLDA